jgi:peptidoglycan biosynthesis protein MviN/MurJ (putative lipid II flippase)
MEGIKKDMFKKVFLLGLILLLITIAYIIAAPFVYTFLFPKYTDSIMLSQIAALSFLSIVAIFPVSALQSQMMERDLHALNIGTAVILLLSMLAGIHFFGLVGLILSRVFVRYVSCILAFVLVYKK